MGWLCSSIAVINKIEIGLNQEWSVPSDSYVLNYFEAQINSLGVGPPVYFVVKSDFDYAHNQIKVCSAVGCNTDSIGGLLNEVSKKSNVTYVSKSVANNWVDSYIAWGQNDSVCCRMHSNQTFCDSTGNY